MKRGLSMLFSVLFFFAVQTQSLAAYAHVTCDQHHSADHQNSEINSHSHSDHESNEEPTVNENSDAKKTETCNQQHHCCHPVVSALQAPKTQTTFLNLNILNLKFTSLDELAVEAPTLEGPFQPPRA